MAVSLRLIIEAKVTANYTEIPKFYSYFRYITVPAFGKVQRNDIFLIIMKVILCFNYCWIHTIRVFALLC